MEKEEHILQSVVMGVQSIASQSGCDAYRKNVCDNILYTLLNDKNKRKDNLAARED